MRKLLRTLLAAACAAAFVSQAGAQPPGGKTEKEPGKEKSKDYSESPLVKRMMAFDKNKDGKLTKEEVTDSRLHRLFDMADANKEGVVTKEELIALAKKLDAEEGVWGGPGGRAPVRFGPGGFGPPPRPGQVLPPFLQGMLKLTAGQKKELEKLQKEVDARLAKILTAEQKKQLGEMGRGFGRGGPGGRGRGGPGGPGGPPPGGPPPER